MAKLTGHLTKTTAPIKSLSDLHAMHHYFLSIAKAATTRSQQLIAYRNWLFFALGINLGYLGQAGNLQSLQQYLLHPQ